MLNALQNDRPRSKEANDSKANQERTSDLLQDITAACSKAEREIAEYISSITVQMLIDRMHGKVLDEASDSQSAHD